MRNVHHRCARLSKVHICELQIIKLVVTSGHHLLDKMQIKQKLDKWILRVEYN